jgi:PAS domain S-box-containing protein
MADSAPVLIWISGADNAMTWFNQTALAFRGRSLDQEIGSGWIGGVHPDDLQPCLDKFVRHVDRHEPFNMEFRLQRHDGKYRWIFESGVPRFDEKGNFLGYIGSGIDISDRVETETRLRILSTAIEQSPISVVIADVDANIEYVNPRFTETSGYTTEEAIGANPRILQSGLTPKETFHALWDKVTNGQIWHGDLVNRRKNGEIYWEEVHIAPVKNEAGVLEHYVAAKVDITELKQAEAARVQLEAQLRESQKMEALGTLAGGVAHDFNNALAMIMGNVELARRCVGRGHEALVSLEEISKASRRAKDLVQQILAFGRRQKLELKTTSLALVVVETERLVRATLPVMVSLSVDCAGDTPAVLADATQIKQLLLNLCSNAADAAQDQDRPGLVEIRLDAHVQNDARGNLRSGRYACLMVRDNGMGMNEKTRSRIFEPFFTTKPVGLGSGLGLSVVHGIVTSHNAALVVDSSANVGSTFRVYFPAVADPVPVDAEPTPVAAPIRGQGNHVLYVDDEEGIVFLMQRLLEHHGFRVSGYTDPRAALAAARANSDQFDLVVTDYNMPHLSGLVLARALRDIRADLPVLLASGYITEEVRAGAAAAGVRELIYKPNTVDDLCAAVMRFVTRHEEVVTNSA